MDTWVWIAIAVGLVIVAAVAYLAYQQNRSRRLKQDFGPEYERAVEEAPSRREAESELAERKKRHDELDIRPLTPAASRRYQQEWEAVQARFVDSPEAAIRDADALIQEVMRERGYPVDDFERRAEDISVDYPEVVEDYRDGRALAQRSEAGEADTEDVRQALVRYRSLFERMLETSDEQEEVRR